MKFAKRGLLSPRNLIVSMVVVAMITLSTVSIRSMGAIPFGTAIAAPTTTNITTMYSATPAELSGLENYFISRYNPQVGLVDVENSGRPGGVTFNQMNGIGACPAVAPQNRFLPFENWKDAYGLYGLGVQTQMDKTVLDTIQSLQTPGNPNYVNWHPPWNAESMIGFPIDYSKGNSNWCFTPTGSLPMLSINGITVQIDQAARWNAQTQSFNAPDMNPNHAKGLKSSAIDETLFQAVNFYIRGDAADSQANLQAVANIAVKNSDGSVGFGSAPYRGMYLGTFIEASELIGTPNLPSGINMNDIVNTLWALQKTQSNGGVPRQYSSFSSGILGSDDETTNAALLAFSPGVIQYVQSVAASGEYNLNTLPSAAPDVSAILTSISTTSSHSSTYSTTSSSYSTASSTSSTSFSTSTTITSSSSSSNSSVTTSNSTTWCGDGHWRGCRNRGG